MKFYTVALCAALGVASQAQAAGGLFSRSGSDERVKSGWVLGAALGLHTHEESIIDETTFDGQGTAYKLFGGYRFNRFFTVEVAYLDGGDPSESYTNDTGTVLERDEVQIHGFQGSVLGSLPLGASAFSLFGRLGYQDSKIDVRVVDTSPPPAVLFPPMTFTSDSQDPFFGIGLIAALDGAILRLEYEYIEFDIDDFVDPDTGESFELGSKSSILSLSVAWIF